MRNINSGMFGSEEPTSDINIVYSSVCVLMEQTTFFLLSNVCFLVCICASVCIAAKGINKAESNIVVQQGGCVCSS